MRNTLARARALSLSLSHTHTHTHTLRRRDDGIKSGYSIWLKAHSNNSSTQKRRATARGVSSSEHSTRPETHSP